MLDTENRKSPLPLVEAYDVTKVVMLIDGRMVHGFTAGEKLTIYRDKDGNDLVKMNLQADSIFANSFKDLVRGGKFLVETTYNNPKDTALTFIMAQKGFFVAKSWELKISAEYPTVIVILEKAE